MTDKNAKTILSAYNSAFPMSFWGSLDYIF